MRPPVWRPPVELSATEEAIIKRIRRAKLFVFLRERRHEIFTDAFQEELAVLYKDSALGQPPVPPAQLALATVLQAYTGVSDDEVIEATTMDRRWQLVLDCHDCTQPPFSKGTFVAFRKRLIEQDFDRRLIERTVEIAETTKAFGSRQLRAALDSSPLWGAGRVEDTYNLLGHALRKALGVLARQQGRGLAAVAAEAGADILGQSSLKAALDCDWDDPNARLMALQQVLAALEAVEAYVSKLEPIGKVTVVPEAPTAAHDSVAVAHAVVAQDVEQRTDGVVTLRRGVARDRRISIEDGQMRHGRKSKHERVDGYKRHVVRDLDLKVVRAVGVTAANVPEATVTDDLAADLQHQQAEVDEWYIDRAYLSSSLVRDRGPDVQIFCKAWPVRNGERFPKTAFQLDWEQQCIRCPNQIVIPFQPGGVVHFPTDICARCPLRTQCTTSKSGRSVTIHPDERLLAELRQRQQTAAGRAKLRERVAVEHSLAHIGHWQGERARYCGIRNNLFDLRRCAVVHNLHVIARLSDSEAA